MKNQELKSIVRRILEIPNTGDFSSVNELIGEDFVYRSSSGEEFHGREGFTELVSTYRSAFPDMEIRPQDIVAEGDTVAMLSTQRGTHQGPLMGMPPSGNEVSTPLFSRLKFKNGKLVDLYEVFNMLDVMRQIGAIDETTQLSGWTPPSPRTGHRPRA